MDKKLKLTCPNCKKVFDFFDNPASSSPTTVIADKSIIMCSGCFLLLTRNKEGVLEEVLEDELNVIREKSPEILEQQRMLSWILAKLKKWENEKSN